MKTTIVPSKDPMKRSPLRRAFLLISLLLVCFGLSPTVKAVSPEPDGGYGNGNTAEGHGAFFNLTTGHSNTALGVNTLFRNTVGDSNTATGASALADNINGNRNTLPVLRHLTETRIKTIAQLMDLTLSISPKAMATQPSVLARSKTILRATATSPWATRPVAILTEAIAILTLATKVLLARVAPFALAVRARQKPLSPALVARE